MKTIAPLISIDDGFDIVNSKILSDRDAMESTIRTFRNCSRSQTQRNLVEDTDNFVKFVKTPRVVKKRVINEPTMKLLLTDRPNMFPDNHMLFPDIRLQKGEKTFIKPYLHNMNYEDLMKWKKYGNNKVFNKLNNKITKRLMKSNIKQSKNSRLFKLNRLLYQPKKERAIIDIPKQMQFIRD